MSSTAGCATTTQCLALMFWVDLRPHVFVLQCNGVPVSLSARAHCVANGVPVIMCEIQRSRTFHLLHAFICMTHICLRNNGVWSLIQCVYTAWAHNWNVLLNGNTARCPFVLFINTPWPVHKWVMASLARIHFRVRIFWPLVTGNTMVHFYKKDLPPAWLSQKNPFWFLFEDQDLKAWLQLM